MLWDVPAEPKTTVTYSNLKNPEYLCRLEYDVTDLYSYGFFSENNKDVSVNPIFSFKATVPPSYKRVYKLR